MINLKNEISQIIYSVDFIVLPGLGAFQTNYSMPHFGKNGDIIEATKSIEFIGLFKKDIDGKLFKLLSQKLGHPIELIHLEYKELFREVKEALIVQKKYDWDGLGLFFNKNDQELQFFEEKRRPKTVEPFKPQVIEASKLAYTATFVGNDEEVMEPEIEEDFKSQYSNIQYSSKRGLFKTILYLSPVLILSAALYYLIFLNSATSDNQSSDVFAEIDSLNQVQLDMDIMPETEKPEVVTKAQDYTPSKAQSIPEPKVETQAEPLKEIKPEIRAPKKESAPVEKFTDNIKNAQYLVKIGVFKNKENVDNLTSFLTENGMPAKVEITKGKYKVYLNAKSESQAIEYMDKIEALTGVRPDFEK